MRTLHELTPTELENLTFDLLVTIGFSNLVWRTPGADGVRDIEGTYGARDVSGGLDVQKWYVECKRYEASIDWPTVYKKIAYADNQNATYLLLVSNSNPSPNCETEISTWNSERHRTKVRFWRGYDVDRILTHTPSVAAKYGLLPTRATEAFGFTEIASQVMKMTQAAYVANSLGQRFLPALEAAAALSELFALRIDDMNRYGKMVARAADNDPVDYDWLCSSGLSLPLPSTMMRAFSATFRYLVNAAKVTASSWQDVITMKAVGHSIPLQIETDTFLSQLAVLCNFEIVGVSSGGTELTFRSKDML